MKDEKSTRRDAFGKALSSWLLVVIAVHFNIFDLLKQSDAASTSWFYFLFSPFVSDRLPGEPIVVVMYDTDELAALNASSGVDAATGSPEQETGSRPESWTWPLSFGQHARLVNALAELSPCAVFFDIGFYQERGPSAELEKALRLNREIGQQRRCLDAAGAIRDGDGPAPLFLADLVSSPVGYALAENVRKSPQDIPMLQGFMDAGARLVPVRWISSENDYPTTVELERADGGISVDPTPAVRMWKEWCDVTGDERCADIAGDRSEISLAWGIGHHPAQPNLPGGGSCVSTRDLSVGGDEPFVRRAGSVIESFNLLFLRIKAVLGAMDETGLWQACPYALTLPASWLAGPNRLVKWCPSFPDIPKVAIDGETYCATRDIMRAFIDGRIVLVGANFPGTDDFTSSPVNGRIPGVYYHANALENLLRFGRDFRSTPQGWAGYAWAAAQLVILLVCLYGLKLREKPLRMLVSRWATAVHERVSRRRTATYLRATAVTIGAVVAAAVFLIVLATLVVTVLSWGLALLILGPMTIEPANWLGMIAAVLASMAEMTAQAVALALIGLWFTAVSHKGIKPAAIETAE